MSKHSNNVHALLSELRQVLDVAWQMAGGARRGECAGESEDDYFLVGPEVGSVVFHRDTAGGYAFGFLGPWDVPELLC